MAYSFDFIALGEKFKTDCCFTMNKDKKYIVYLKDVYFKEAENKHTHMHKPIQGCGFTFEDACKDFYRIARTGYLYHIITNQLEHVI